MKEKKTRYEMRFAGSGGQGVILCSIILAEAAFLAGKRVAQSQSYGPEARGGLCRAELVVDENEITYPKVTQPDFLLTLTQASLDKFGANTSEDALIMIDKSLLEPDDLGSYNVVSLPILHTAARVVGKPMTANIVAVGAINELLAIAPEDTLREAVKMHIPRGTEEINMQALTEGMKLGASAKWTVTLPEGGQQEDSRISGGGADRLLRGPRAAYGVRVPEGQMAKTAAEAEAVARALGEGPFVIKAQVHSGGRGKAGGVKFANTPGEAAEKAKEILGMTLVTKQTGPQGRVVQKVLVSRAMEIAREYYLSLTVDGARERVVLIASPAGGMEIEETAKEAPEKILTMEIDP